MSSNNKLDKNGLNVFWTKVFTLVKTITGDVDVKNKGTLQNQVDDVSTKVTDCFTSVSNGKKVVANAITGKGITTAEDAEFATMADNINKIKSNPTLQAKSATLHTGNIKVTLTPDDGYDGLSAATASITLQEKSVTLSTTAQTVTPDSGKVLSKVSVPAVAGNAATNNVLAGKTFNSATAGIGKTGTMKSKAGTSVKASATSQDDNNTYLTIPEAGYYDETSKVYTENSNLSGKSLKIVHFETGGSGNYKTANIIFDVSNFSTLHFDGTGGIGSGGFAVLGGSGVNIPYGIRQCSLTNSVTLESIGDGGSSKKEYDISKYSYIRLYMRGTPEGYDYIKYFSNISFS